MPYTYTVVCREGEHEYSWRDVATFDERSLADRLCVNAQGIHDKLRESLPGNVRLTGLNPADPGMDSFWEKALYYVQQNKVSPGFPADLAAADAVSILDRSTYLPSGTGYFTAFDVDSTIGDRKSKVASALYDFELYDSVSLLRVQYRGLTFVLELQGGLVECSYRGKDESLEYRPVSYLTVTPSEEAPLRRGSSVRRDNSAGVAVSYKGACAWTCEDFDIFHKELDVLPRSERELLSQFTRTFEYWLDYQIEHRRQEDAELDATLKRFGF